MVYWWCEQGNIFSQRLKQATRWLAPAAVLKQEGQSRVFISYRGVPVLCSTHQLRRATREEYDAVVLGKYINKREYIDIMERINNTLENYFPCPLCWCFGYVMAIFTLGLSLCLPAICVNDAETNVRQFIAACNRKRL